MDKLISAEVLYADPTTVPGFRNTTYQQQIKLLETKIKIKMIENKIKYGTLLFSTQEEYYYF